MPSLLQPGGQSLLGSMVASDTNGKGRSDLKWSEVQSRPVRLLQLVPNGCRDQLGVGRSHELVVVVEAAGQLQQPPVAPVVVDQHPCNTPNACNCNTLKACSCSQLNSFCSRLGSL